MNCLTVNFHLTNICNYQCIYCYSHYSNNKGTLTISEKKQIIENIAQSGQVKKINFAGGEPLIDCDLSELIKYAKSFGFVTSLISNGSLFTQQFLDNTGAYLDIVGISCDSGDNKILKELKSGAKEVVIKTFRMIDNYNKLGRNKIFKKLNTVVTKINLYDKMNDFVSECNLDRWKILQVLPIKRENDKNIKDILISETEFDEYVNRHKIIHGNIIIPENNRIMEDSYLMIDPSGNLYQNSNQEYKSGTSLISNNLNDALQKINFDYNKFIERKGIY